MTFRRSGAAALAIFSFWTLTSSCGYHVGGKGDLVPKSVQTIAVLPFRNLTTRYRLSDAFQQAISRELIARTRFQVVRDSDKADAVLNGTISSVYTGPLVFDPATGRTSLLSIAVYMSVSLSERGTGKVLYIRPNFEMHSSYQIAVNPSQYFDESTLALDRVSADLARSLVSGIMENF